ncbi:hypothetical protein Q3G72_010049 [Acer saccharum]|nr:hypothetical protein Q3G72_010049 [Acer saccharum]
MEGQYPSEAALQAAQLSLRCLELDPRSRPSMKEVMEVLKEIEAQASHLHHERPYSAMAAFQAAEPAQKCLDSKHRNLKLLSEPVRVAGEKVRWCFCKIANADKVSNVEKINMLMPDVEKSCKDRLDGFNSCNETQTSSSPTKARELTISSNCLLYSPAALWPEIGLRHLARPVAEYPAISPHNGCHSDTNACPRK